MTVMATSSSGWDFRNRFAVRVPPVPPPRITMRRTCPASDGGLPTDRDEGPEFRRLELLESVAVGRAHPDEDLGAFDVDDLGEGWRLDVALLAVGPPQQRRHDHQRAEERDDDIDGHDDAEVTQQRH